MEFINLSLVFGNTEEADWVTIKKSFNRATEQISEIYSTRTNHTGGDAFYFTFYHWRKEKKKSSAIQHYMTSFLAQNKWNPFDILKKNFSYIWVYVEHPV